MSQIKQLLLLYQQGQGRKTIARTIGISKNTVKCYLQKLQSLLSDSKNSLMIADLVKFENPVLEAIFHAGSPAYKEEDRYEQFKEKLPYFLGELKRKGVTKHLLWQEYRQDFAEGYGYSQFCFHLQQQQIASNPSMVLEHKPGEKLYIDFAGRTLHYIDKDSGEAIDCQIFVACLPYSDYSFAMAVATQSVSDFLFALAYCLQYLKGVPVALVPDNLKSAVIVANRYEPKINQALEDFASHYSMVILPARAKKPKDKALVENQVKLVYNRVYAKLRDSVFFDIQSLNKAIAEKIREHNQTRMQQKPYCREECFLAEEQKHLRFLPAEKFELKYYTELTVAKNNHIYLSQDKHYYSVPYKIIAQKVKVIYTRTMVYIFHKADQVAVHIRCPKPGSYTTNRDHLCSHHKHYLDRSPEYYLRLGQEQSEVLHALMKDLFNQNKHPEQLYKTCDGLLNLSRKADASSFEAACRVALENQVYSYMFVKNFLEHKMNASQQRTPAKTLPDHKNIRGKNYYQ